MEMRTGLTVRDLHEHTYQEICTESGDIGIFIIGSMFVQMF